MAGPREDGGVLAERSGQVTPEQKKRRDRFNKRQEVYVLFDVEASCGGYDELVGVYGSRAKALRAARSMGLDKYPLKYKITECLLDK